MSDQVGNPEARFSHVAAHTRHDRNTVHWMLSKITKKIKCCYLFEQHHEKLDVWHLRNYVKKDDHLQLK